MTGQPEPAAPSRVGSTVVQARLFWISYAPLLAIFAVESHDLVTQSIFGGLATLAVVDAVRLVRAANARTARDTHLTDINDKSSQVAGYLATYLLPFISGPPTTWRLWVGYGIYFLVAFVVSARADQGLINPTLYLFGRRVVGATVRGRRVLIVTTAAPVRPGTHKLARLMGGAGYVLAGQPTKTDTVG